MEPTLELSPAVLPDFSCCLDGLGLGLVPEREVTKMRVLLATLSVELE